MFFRKKIPDEISDYELIVKYRAEKDLEILSLLFGRYVHLVYGICLKYLKNSEESKDAAAEIFNKLTTAILKFEISSFKSWLYTLTKNHCLEILRKKRRGIESISFDEFPEESFMENESIEHLIEQKKKDNMLNMLDDTLNKLEESQKICIKLFYLEEKSYKQIAEQTGFTLNQVKSYIQNGKRNMKNILSSEGDKVDII